MNNKNNMEDELHEAPFLSGQARDAGFKAPEAYFDSFEARLKNRLEEETRPKATASTQARMLWLQPRFIAAAAAVVLLIACFTFLQLETEDVQGENMAQRSAVSALQEVSLEEAEAYVLEHIEEFDDELLMASMKEDETMTKDLSEQELNEYLKEEGLENLSEEELEQLL